MSSCMVPLLSISTTMKIIDETIQSPPVTKKKVSFLNTYKVIEYEQTKQRKPICRILNQITKAKSWYLTSGSTKPANEMCKNAPKRLPPFWRPTSRQQDAFRIFLKTQNRLDRKMNKELKYNVGPNYRSRQKVDIRSRIFVPETIQHIKTILDLDPLFYSLVEGRPIQYKHMRNEYIMDISNCCQNHLQAGYMNDEKIKLELDQAREEMILKKIDEAIDEYSDSFEKFLANDHDNSQKIMEDAFVMRDELRKKNEELKLLKEEMVSCANKVVELGEKCSRYKSYQNFIYQLSPYSWCKENEIKKSMKRSPSDFSLEELCSVSLVDYSESKASTSVLPLDKVVDTFNKVFEFIQEPKMYFKHAWQLPSMFKTIVMMNFRSWSNSEKLAERLSQVKAGICNLENRLVKEFEDIQNIVTDLASKIEDEEKKANDKKRKAMKLINTHFYSAVASDDVLKLQIGVQDVYERLNFPDVNFSTFDMMKILELEYESCMHELNDIDHNCVKQAQKQCYAEDKLLFKSAEEASKKLKKLSVLRAMHQNAFSRVSHNLNKFELLFLNRKYKKP